MRRWLHCAMVTLLSLGMFVNSAMACWCQRHHGRGFRQPCSAPTISPPGWPCPTAVVAWTDSPVLWHGQVVHVTACHDVVPLGAAFTCCDPSGSIVQETIVPFTVQSVPCADSLMASAPEESAHVADSQPAWAVAEPDQPAPAAAPETADVVVHDPTIVSAAPKADPLPQPETVPPAAGRDAKKHTGKDEPVVASHEVPAAAEAPGEEKNRDVGAQAPAEAATPQPMAAALAAAELSPRPAVVPPAERNLFDEFDEAAAGPPDAPGDATAEPEIPAEKPGPGDGDAPEAGTNGEQLDSASALIVPDERLREWTAAAGGRRTQGWLTEIGSDTVRILKLNGRYATLSLVELSEADQAYVGEVRVAASRAQATSTAGL